jgi:D-sedoheptulose 7-phosphate isomerase
MEIMDFSSYVDEINNVYKKFDRDRLNELIQVLEKGYHKENTIFTFGNGGSGASASHFCEDLGKGTLQNCNGHKRFKVMSLTDNLPYILAWANDHGYETIFDQQLRNFAKIDDIAIGISCSGNSQNVIRAIEYANSIGMVTVGFTGYDGGKLKNLVEHSIHVPSMDIGIVESIHVAIMHYIVSLLKNKLYA